MTLPALNQCPTADAKVFRELATFISALATLEDLRITPFTDEALPNFTALPADRRALVLKRLERLRGAATTVRREGHRMSSAKLIWAYLKNVRQTAPSDLIAHLTDDDCVDFYGLDHQLVFANLSFFRATSYSLEQLYCLPWPTLYRREQTDVEPALIELSGRVSSPGCGGILDASHLPSYEGTESLSSERRRARMQPRFCAPVFERGANAGYLWVNRVTLL